ncbi:hypothetical protein DBR40_21110 [Pedobacter sp. KBW01]|nr:hypothetical protein DBR40_21110 [Pedobacter sp. KBW01]
MSKGKLDIPKRESYTVVYQANFGQRLTGNAIYTGDNGKLVEQENVTGSWQKTFTLKSGTHVQLETLAKSKSESRAEYKILVEGKVVSEYVLSGKRLNYTFAFDLP